MDSFYLNYIKPRTSKSTNMNASLITNKRQSQMIFTGYVKQVEAISQMIVKRPATIFNGSDGLAVKNLKDGSVWTSPETLNAITNS